MRTLRFGLLLIAFLMLGYAAGAAADLKAPWKGAVHPFGQVPAGWENVVEDVVVKVYWKNLEPQEDQYVYSSIDNFVNTAAAKNCNVYIRMFAGPDCPTWLNDRVGTVTIVNEYDGVTNDVVQWWKPEVRTAYRDLMQTLAARYDGTNRPDNSRILAITMSRCMTTYAEPFIRELSSAETRANLRAAGYTGELDKVCQIETVQDHAEIWQRTRSSFAINPYQNLTATDWNTDMAFTFDFMDQAHQILGPRLLLQNNSLRPIDLLGGVNGNYGKLYDKMHELFMAGATIGFQSAQFVRQDNRWKEALQQATDYGASYVELTDSWNNTASRGVTSDELTAFDTIWENMAPPPAPLEFTRGSKWNSANTGNKDNSGYNANNRGVTGSWWIYEMTSTGGNLASADPFYRQPGTLLTWDSTNNDWDFGGGVFYPQINQVGLAAQSSPAEQAKSPRASWIAPASGKVGIEGNLRVSFFKDAAAKSAEWVIGRRTGSAWTSLATGTMSIAAGEATNSVITKRTDLTPDAYPNLVQINVTKGDAVFWATRAAAQAGSNGYRMNDDQMTLTFQPDQPLQSAVESFTLYE